MVTTTAQATTKPLSLTDELRQKTKGLHGKTDRLVTLGLFAVLDYQVRKYTPQIHAVFFFLFFFCVQTTNGGTVH